MVQKNLSQGRNRDADVEGYVDTEQEGEGGMNWEIGMYNHYHV